MKSSSGGLTSWLLEKLLEIGYVDAVLSVGRATDESSELFGYSVAYCEDLRTRRKSQYYASTMSEVLTFARQHDKRFAVVGVPCYIKAARTVCREDAVLASRLVLFIGLVCGHLKTQAYAESLAWQLGISPRELAEVDFRIKAEGRPASDYDFGARRSGESSWLRSPTRLLVGSNWGYSAFQPEACNFCDDVVAETSDVTFGDAWLPHFVEDFHGANLVICRNRLLEGIFETGQKRGEIVLTPLDPSEAVQSQAGGFRYRREGLALRLSDDIAAGLSVPRKRVRPDPRAVSFRRAALLRQRRRMARLSHAAFAEAIAAQDLTVYLGAMKKEIARYKRLDLYFARRTLVYVKRFLPRARAEKTRDREGRHHTRS
ncbi:MAG: coenzyme F420 hydrogenase [Propionibacterium sp.]|nr:coenzyme F420 hydrogenase [Propionibacterium sp.]